MDIGFHSRHVLASSAVSRMTLMPTRSLAPCSRVGLHRLEAPEAGIVTTTWRFSAFMERPYSLCMRSSQHLLRLCVAPARRHRGTALSSPEEQAFYGCISHCFVLIVQRGSRPGLDGRRVLDLCSGANLLVVAQAQYVLSSMGPGERSQWA